MDKYTVDLDKVLNDFEYSELTDQYNVSRQSGSQQAHTVDSPRTKVKDTNVKHSINNVFHSLNEYLNSDINVKSYEPNLNGNTNASVKIVKEPLSDTLNYAPLHEQTKISDAISNLVKSNIELAKVENDLKGNVVEDEETHRLVDVSFNDEKEAEDDDDDDDRLSVDDDDGLPAYDDVYRLENASNSETEQTDLSDGANGSEAANEQSPHVTTELVEQEEAPIVVETEVHDVPSAKTTHVEALPVETIVDEVKTIGFEDTADLDESEVYKYLEELENEECDIESDDEEPIKNVREDRPAEPEAIEEAYEESTTDTLNSSEDTESSTRTDDVQSEDETKTSTVLPSSQECEATVADAPECADNKSNDLSEKESENNSTLSRPNTLELTAGNSEATTVNLIGDPGSTPYNNFYVSNALDSENHTAGTASSLSPTVSELSTDSPNSSESIDVPAANVPVPSCDADDATGGTQLNNGTDSPDLQDDVRLRCDSGTGAWKLGKTAPFWIPDSDTANCQHCDVKFTVLKRRHHCRACGYVLCSRCCNQKYKLDYLDGDARVCIKCYEVLSAQDSNSTSGSDASPQHSSQQPNPNNPMEYCSVIPPLQQVENRNNTPPTVMVPVGVLKRRGATKTRTTKSVMFCDGIRPGSDLTELDQDVGYVETKTGGPKKQQQSQQASTHQHQAVKVNKNVPRLDTKTSSYIPNDLNGLPPTVTIFKSDVSYTDCANTNNVVEMLKNEPLLFSLQRNLYVHVRIINMDCCVNKLAWCFSTDGMITVGQDEIVVLLEFIDNESAVPKDVFLHLNSIYMDAVKGSSISEYGISIHDASNFLDSKNHAGFLFIRPTFQCLGNVIIPKEPYLIGILIHRWETPWAKIFPLRLVLRLGAEYRYYPSPIISTRHRESVYVEIGHTIINLLADFRNFSYTLPNIRGLSIHMEEKNTTVTIPMNRYDQVLKSLNNSSDHILAFAGNFSSMADSHLVCIQATDGNNENAYTTHAINIQNKPRKVTGASFIVFNGALKSSSGLSAKSSIIEDGLMIQILPERMMQIRDSLRNMKDHTIQCGCANAKSDESVTIVWGENDAAFNAGVKSPIDGQSFDGVPSIRVHNGKDFVCGSGGKMIRWTEVFILQNGEDGACSQEPVDISKLAESISKASSQALVKYLDLLATNNYNKVGVRTTLHVDNVSYMAGSNGIKLPPIYMKSLDNELIPVLHRITTNNLGENPIVLELIFHVLNM